MRNTGWTVMVVFSCVMSAGMTACSYVSGKLLIMEGNFYHARGSYTEAITAYMRARDYEEAAPYSEFGLGSVYIAMGEEKAALECFDKARKLLDAAPSAAGQELHYRIHYNTGVALFSDGNFSGAVDSFQEALKTDGSRKEAKRNLELSIRMLDRESVSPAGSQSGESDGMSALFEYVREKELGQWKSREWQDEDETQGPDY